jgi:hypothetical protein
MLFFRSENVRYATSTTVQLNERRHGEQILTHDLREGACV